MAIKKNPEVDNERLRIPLIFLGFFIVGSIITLSFSFKEEVSLSSINRQEQDQDKIPKELEIIEEENKPEEPVVQEVEQLEVNTDLNLEIDPVENKDDDEKITIQQEDIKIVDKGPEPAAPIVDYPDNEATFPGGPAAMKKFLADHIKYPEIAMELGDQGRVFIEFVVNKDGTIEQVKILRGVSKEINVEAKRVVHSMPKWTPASTGGENVRARCRIPINFILQ